MADDSEPLGSLPVEITGDFSELQDALNEAASAAQDGSDQIVSALQGVIDASGLAGGDLNIFKSVLEDDQAAGIDLAQTLQDLSESAKTVGDVVAEAAANALQQLKDATEAAGDSAESTRPSWDELAASVQYVADAAAPVPAALEDISNSEADVAEHSAEAESGLQSVATALAGLYVFNEIKEAIEGFLESALEAYGETQNLATVLELLGSSAEEAEEKIDQLSDMSLNLAVPFAGLEASTQRLTAAFQGVKGVDITDILTSAADASAVTGKSFDSVATALQRVATQGQVTARQLLSLGITWQQLADQADTSVAQVQATLKKGGQTAVQDLNLVTATIESVSGGAAQAIAQNVSGQMQILSNQVTLMFDKIGQDIAPVAVAVIQALDGIVQEVRTLATDFQTLPEFFQNAIVAAAGLTGGVVALGAAASILGYGLKGLIELGEGVTAVLGLGARAAGAEAGAEASAAAATAAHGLAAAGAIPEIEGLGAAEAQSAIAAEANATGMAIQMGLFGEQTAVATTAATQMELFAGATGASTAATGLFSGGLATTIPILAAIAAGAVLTVSNAKELPDAFSQAGESLAKLNTFFSDGANEMLAFGGGATAVDDDVSGASSSIKDANSVLPSWTSGLGEAVNPMDAVSHGAKVLQEGIDTLTGSFTSMEAAAKSAASTLQIAGNQMAAGWAAAASAGVTTNQQVSTAVQAVISNLGTLQSKVTAADAALGILKQSFETGIVIPGTQAVATLAQVEAAQVILNKTETALNSAMGFTTEAMGGIVQAGKPAADSFEALAQSANDASTKFDTANTTWANFMTALNNGSTTINGVATSANNANIAWNNLAAAYQKATGAVLQWNEASGNTAGIVQGQVNSFTNLQNAVAQTGAALKVQQDAYNAAVVAGTATDEQLQQLQIAYLANQKAIAAMASATNTAGVSMDQLTGKSQDYVQVIINGVPAVAGYTNAQLAAARQSDATTNAIGGVGTAVQDLLNKYASSVAILQGNTTGVRNLSQAQTDAAAATKALADAQQALATQQAKTAQAWQDGYIVMQNYNGQLVKETTASTDAGTSANDMATAIANAKTTMQGSSGAANDYATSLENVASAANDAATGIGKLKAAGGGGGGSGSEGAQLQGMEDLGSTALLSLQTLDPFLSQFTNPGSAAPGNPNESLSGYSPDNTLQAISNETNQAVQSIYGTFIPATQAAANYLQGLQDEANATGKTLLDTFGGVDTVVSPQLTAMAQVAQANAESTGGNTTATTANTAAVVASTPAFTVMNSTMAAAAAAGDDVVTSFAQLPSTIQDYLDSVNATLVGYDDTTGQLEYTTAVLNSFGQATSQAMHTVGEAADELSSAETSTAVSLATVAESSTSAADSMQQLVSSTAQAGSVIAQAATQVGTASSDVMGVVQKITGTLSNSIFGNSANAATGIGSADMFSPLGAYSNPNPGLMEGYAPNDGAGSNPTIQIIVTGNFAASDSSIQMLANKVASAATTQLRTLGGLKN